MMTPVRTAAIALVLFLIGSPASVFAQENDADESADDAFSEIVEGAERHPGFFETYQKEGKLYIVISSGWLEKEFLLTGHISQGIGSSMLFGGLMLDALIQHRVVALERYGDKIFLVQQPVEFTADEGSPVQQTVELSFGSSVLDAVEIEASRGDSLMIVDATNWFVNDLVNVESLVRRAVATGAGKPGRVTLDKDRSHLKSVEGFADNVNIDVRLTFKPAEPKDVKGVPDSRYIPISIQYGLVRLPEDPMIPRRGDDRVGYFLTARKNFSKDVQTFFDRFIWKWRLECADEPGDDGLCEPIEPITYYVDHTVPVEYRQTIIEGIEAFQPAFEEAGFRNAIRGAILPDSADASDIRYATVRWSTSDVPSYGAIGPSIKDPRTGEILDADILIEANMVMGWRQLWHRMVNPNTIVESAFEANEFEMQYLASGGETADFVTSFVEQGALVHAFLASAGEISPDDPVPDELIYQGLKFVVMHELGHTLGLRHNFRSSADTPLDKLNDRRWSEEKGLVSSIMDYAAVNLSPKGQDDGYYFSPGIGSYDSWAIAYGYTPDDNRAAELARRSAEPGHAYGTDEDARGPGAVDPTTNVWDLGADPLEWGMERASVIKSLWPSIPEFALADDEGYYEATYALRTLLNQYIRAVGAGVKYIGGQYQYRDHVGDPDARMPFEPVPRERQAEALEFTVNHVFSDSAFSIPPEVLRTLGADRWNHWGHEMTVLERIDYPYHEIVVKAQSAILEQITHPFVFTRILDAEQKYGSDEVLTIPELMTGLTEAIWSEAWSAPGSNVSASRRAVQRVHLDRLTKLIVDPPERTPADARSVARLIVEDLAQRLSQRLSPPYEFDDYTLAHFRESLARAEKTAAAGLELDE